VVDLQQHKLSTAFNSNTHKRHALCVCCNPAGDYIWYTSNPLMGNNARQPGANSSSSGNARQAGADSSGNATGSGNARQAGADSSAGSSGSNSNGNSSGSSSSGDHYELRPVAVLQPPDGLSLNKGLPSKALGSDHICLLTDFELVLRQQKQ
jgi:hypothetical protein